MNRVFIFLIAVSLTACSSLKVNTDFDKSITFSKYKTFSFYQFADKGQSSVGGLNKSRIISAIRTEMIKKGFTETASGTDVWVNATTILENKKSVTSTTNYYGYGGYYRPYGWGAGNTTSYNVHDYKSGSLIIDIIDASTKQLIWQGTGNKDIEKPSSDPDKAIAEIVSAIMKDFPPGKDNKK